MIGLMLTKPLVIGVYYLSLLLLFRDFNRKCAMIVLMKIIIIIAIKCFRKNIHINNINMLHHDRTDISEGIDVNQTSAPK